MNIIKNYLISQLFVTFISIPIIAIADLNEAVELYENSQFEASVKHLQQLSNQGESDAKLLLAAMIFNGVGIGKDQESAVKLMEEAADAHHPEATWQLGWLLLENNQFKQYTQNKDALALIIKAAEQDIADAQLTLGNLYKTGNLVDKNYEKSVFWFQKSAAQNNVQAIHSLGVAYYNGWGVPKDYKKSAHWFSISAAQDLNRSIFNLATMYRDGKGVLENKEEAHRLFLISAKNGNKEAMNQVMQNYYNGDGVERDLIEGSKWLYESTVK